MIINMRIITQQLYATCTRLCTSAYIQNYSYLWLFTESFPVTAYSKILSTNLIYLLEPTRDYFVPIFHLMYKCFYYSGPGPSALSLPVSTFDSKLGHSLYLGLWAHTASYYNPDFIMTVLYYISSLSLDSLI
jgi:hypothetical protein